MKILVFDTETTGFINKKEFDIKKQPYIIQFAGILGEIEGGEYKEIERKNIFINPGIPIPYAASQVHHIYDIDVKEAKNMSEQIDEIMQFINKAQVLIGHNIEYDEDMLKLELKRYEKSYLYNPEQTLCTMKQTVDYCALQGKGERYKYPKLGELYKKLFGEYFIGAHDAMIDVEATLQCFLELERLKIIQLNKSEKQVMSLF